MLALKLTDIKDFMNKLLRSDIFDHFLLQEADILTGASFVIDGHINKDFYSSEELEALGLTDHKALPFSMLRTQCFDLIKGKKTPSSFKFIFLLSPDNLSRTLASVQSSYTVSDISGMFLNLRYQKTTYKFIPFSLKTFVRGKDRVGDAGRKQKQLVLISEI